MKTDGNCCFMVLVQVAVIATMGMLSSVFSGGPGPDSISESSTLQTGANVESESLVICPEPRPELCTMEYRPVCAQMADGRSRIYANGCASCSDPDVVGYHDGACEEE